MSPITLKALLVSSFVALCAATFVWFKSYLSHEDTPLEEFSLRCDLAQEPCIVHFPDKSIISLQITPFPIVPLEPFQLTVKGQNLTDNELLLWFEGAVMEMGKHFLLPEGGFESNEEGQAFKGMIPVCSIDERMEWILKMRIKTHEGTYVYRVEF